MLGTFHFRDAKINTTTSGKMELVLSVAPESAYYIRSFVWDIKQKRKEFTGKFTWRKRARSLDQNALMWKLLEIYADTVNGGRQGGERPEGIYMRMLSKYGVAEFVIAVEEAEAVLCSTFRHVIRVDRGTYNGKEMVTFKCILGSSQYDTKQMKNLIDGIFDDLADLGVDPGTSREVASMYDEWRAYKMEGG